MKHFVFAIEIILISCEGWVDVALKDIASHYVKRVEKNSDHYYNLLQKLITSNLKRNELPKPFKKNKTLKKHENHQNISLSKDQIFDSMNKLSRLAFSDKSQSEKSKESPKSTDHSSSKTSSSDDHHKSSKSKEHKSSKKKNQKHKTKIDKEPSKSLSKNQVSDPLITNSLDSQPLIQKNSPILKPENLKERIKRNSVKRILKEELIATTLSPPTLLTTLKHSEYVFEEYRFNCFSKILQLHHKVFSLYGEFRRSKLEDRANISKMLFEVLSDFWVEFDNVVNNKCAFVIFKLDELNVILENDTIVLPSFPSFDFSYMVSNQNQSSEPVSSDKTIPPQFYSAPQLTPSIIHLNDYGSNSIISPTPPSVTSSILTVSYLTPPSVENIKPDLQYPLPRPYTSRGNFVELMIPKTTKINDMNNFIQSNLYQPQPFVSDIKGYTLENNINSEQRISYVTTTHSPSYYTRFDHEFPKQLYLTTQSNYTEVTNKYTLAFTAKPVSKPITVYPYYNNNTIPSKYQPDKISQDIDNPKLKKIIERFKIKKHNKSSKLS